jgi:hypothetical protein
MRSSGRVIGMAMVLGLLIGLPARTVTAIEIAGDLLVELSAADLDPLLENLIWTNTAPAAAQVGNFNKLGMPVVEEIGGVKCMSFNSVALGGDAYQSDLSAPAGLVNVNPTCTIEAWVLNPAILDEETIVSWGHRGGGCGTNMSFNYGMSNVHGAVGHWCNNPGPDIGWGAVPAAGQWHHLAYTYDGTTTRVYVDGELTNREIDFMPESPNGLNTWPLPKITLADQLTDNNSTLNLGTTYGTLSIARLRIHEEFLQPEQIKINYDEEKGDFGQVCTTPAFLDMPTEEVTFKGIPYVFMRRFQVDGTPAPTVTLVEPIGATLSADGIITYDLPATPPASFTVTLHAESCGGTADASWTVNVKDPPAAGQLETADALIVDLDAAHASAGTDTWVNRAPDAASGAGDFVKVGNPVLATVLGAPAVSFNLADTQDSYSSANTAPDGIIGFDPTYSVETWVYTERGIQEQTILCWSYRGDPAGSNMSFNCGSSPWYGAMGHWGDPDMGWHHQPPTGRWHHLVYTFDGNIQHAYADGRETNYEILGSGIINLKAGNIHLATQMYQDATTLELLPEWGLRGMLSLGQVRIHDGVLSQEQVLSNYLAEKDKYSQLPPAVVPAKLPQGPVHRYSFTGDAMDSVGGADGLPYGFVLFEDGQAILENFGTELSNASGKSPPAAPPGAYIDLPNGIVSALGAAGSFEAWVTWGGPWNVWMRIFDFGRADEAAPATGEDISSGAGASPYLILSPYSGNGTLRFMGTNSGNAGEQAIDGEALQIDEEYHVVGVWDSAAGKASLYVDGVKIGDGPAPFPLSDLQDVNNWLGRSQWADPMFKGSYNEFRIYNYALTPEQVLGSFQAGPDQVEIAPAGADVVRDFVQASFGPAGTVDVSLAITMLLGNTSIAIEEVLPDGATASAISDDGVQVGNTVRWDLTGITATKTVTYKLTSPSTCIGQMDLPGSSWATTGSRGLIGGETSIPLGLSDEALGDWQAVAIDAPGSGAEAIGGNEIVVKGTGAGIKAFSKADGFIFVNFQASGDFEFQATIDCKDDPSFAGTTAGIGGIMVRDSVDAFSAHAFVGLNSVVPTAGGIGTFAGLYRVATDATKTNTTLMLTNTAVVSLPVTLRARRSTADGKLYFERLNADGITWDPMVSRTIGAGTLDLKDQVLIGLAVTGTGAEAMYTFSGVGGPSFPGVAPEPPTNLVATGGTKQVSLTWSAPTTGPAPTGYAVYRDDSKVAEVGDTSYTDTLLEDATQYCYKVKTMVGTTESAFSDEACATTTEGPEGSFRRGDTDGSGKLDLTDAIATLQFLYMGYTAPACKDAADTDDSGTLDLTDAIASLQFQFMGGTAPASPGPVNCGPDPTPGDQYTECTYTTCNTGG